MATPQNWFAANQSNVQPCGLKPRAMMSAFAAPYWPKICLMPIAPTNGGRTMGTSTAELSRPLRG